MPALDMCSASGAYTPWCMAYAGYSLEDCFAEEGGCVQDTAFDDSKITRRALNEGDVDAWDNSLIDRILTVPPGAEVTGLGVINGDLHFNAQHPNEEYGKPSIGITHGFDYNKFPISDAENVPATSSDVKVAYGTYQTLAVSGHSLPVSEHLLGEIIIGEGKTVSPNPDFSGFVTTNTARTEGYLYTSWESRPAGISRLKIEKTIDGSWLLREGEMLDASGVNGLWQLCFGTVTPWNTPLHSEELYEDSTKKWIDNRESVEKYTDLNTHIGRIANPYDYGFIVEVQDADQEKYKIVKHRTLGRFSHENSEVMGDRKTVYLSDDGTSTVFFKFVAENTDDLSKGTLYAAKMTQDNDDTASERAGFNITWIQLGEGKNEEIEVWANQYTDTNNYITDEEILNQAEAKKNGESVQDNRAAFLESRKFAKAMGATAEWNKMEGIRYNPKAPKYAYMAMSTIAGAMTDNIGDVQVKRNICGVVYRLRIDTMWNIDRMEPVIAGKPTEEGKCDVAYVANPDNIVVLDDGRVIIGEDTSKHDNNMAWLWQGVGGGSNNDDDTNNPCASLSRVKKMCGPCKALVNIETHESCHEYCRSNELECVNARDDTKNDCTERSINFSCAHKFRKTSDAICQCMPIETCDLSDTITSCGPCMALVKIKEHNTCANYCRKNGYKCVNAWEDVSNKCNNGDQKTCNFKFNTLRTSDAICKCESS